MFLEIIENDLGSIDEILKGGNIKVITKYLIENIYVMVQLLQVEKF